MTMEQQVRGAVARGWCHQKNAKKEMDTDLAEAITEEVVKSVAAERERCAKIAEAHKGSYAKRPNYKQLIRNADYESLDEIRAEERGEDIAAEIIARTIRAL